ncbi:MAG: HAMP domain-containing sensor histidine kinase [Microcella sp.]|uniref:sensor histidine kinase n=1 Tax=Microcella sp. TaxID=1913979 RepID=UPI0027185395|nr:HAMP domain-containing sensor histidine kinase [Microcella sp.]MDO8337621.1 HAMP domain-containing sensor histidine kinase [Microcella sp.]
MTATTDAPTLDDRPLVSPRYTARLLQGTFALLFLLATLVVVALEPATVTNPFYAGGAALVLVATAFPLLPAFRNVRYRPWMIAMPLLDFAAILLIRLEGTGGITNPMVMILTMPAVWVGLVKSRRALAMLMPAVLAVVVPDALLVARGALSESTADRAVMLIATFPIVMMFAAGAAYAMSSILAGRQMELADEQRRRAEAAADAERARNLLHAVLDTIPVGVVVMSPTGERILMNRRLRESPELMADGADPWDAIQEVRALMVDRVTRIEEEQSAFQHAARGETVTDRLVWVGLPGQQQHALSVSTGPVHTDAGEHLANVLVVSDVTDFMHALEAKDAFIGTISHELRTPLTTLSGFVELLIEREHEFRDDVRSWLKVIDRNVRRQHMLVRDLLAAAATRNAPIVIDRQPSDLAAIAHEAALAVRSEAEQKGVAVAVSGEATGNVDPLRMAQVVENLLTNAVRYTPAGGSVSVSVGGDADHLHLVVSDTGVGIAPEDQERLFEQFFRAADARASAIRGIGLGLAIVKAIVDAHGGEVALESEPGRGTTVTVRIPQSA